MLTLIWERGWGMLVEKNVYISEADVDARHGDVLTGTM